MAAQHAAALRFGVFTVEESKFPDSVVLRPGLFGLLIALATVGLSSCHSNAYYYYKFPEYTFANRPVPPSKLANRVMVGFTANGSSGALQLLDASRDIRSTVQNPNQTFTISGFSAPYPSMIFNFPEEVHGYVYSPTGNSLQIVNYSTEASAGSGGSLAGVANSIAIPDSSNHIYSAEQTIGQLGIIDNTTGHSYGLNLPNVYQVAVNTGDTVVLAMVKNSEHALSRLQAEREPVRHRTAGDYGHWFGRLPAV